MTEQKCKGCQSFCMRGAQLAGQAPGTPTDGKSTGETKKGTYPDGWKTWKNITKDSSYIAAPANSGLTTYLSAENHNDLINFIKDTYSEGKFNCQDGTLTESLNTFSSKNKGKLQMESAFSTASACPTTLTGNTVTSNTIMSPSHYNNFTGSLYIGGENKSPITQDAKGDKVTGNPSEAGPVAGKPISDTTPAKSQSDFPKDDSSLIKADMYKDLYDQASKLLYHPYQCNICNIYEGGEWLEICDDIAKDLQSRNVQYTYSGQTTSTEAARAGITVTNMRQDCSGYVSACLDVMKAIETGGGPTVACSNLTSHAFQGSWPSGYSVLEKYFTYKGGGNPGAIWVRIAQGDDGGHIEIQGESGKYSGGGLSGKPANEPMMSAVNTGTAGSGKGSWVNWRFNGPTSSNS